VFLAPADREKATHFEAFWHLDGGVRQAYGVETSFIPTPTTTEHPNKEHLKQLQAHRSLAEILGLFRTFRAQPLC